MTRSNSPPLPSLHGTRCSLRHHVIPWLGCALVSPSPGQGGKDCVCLVDLPTQMCGNTFRHPMSKLGSRTSRCPAPRCPPGCFVQVSPLCSGRLQSLGRSGPNCCSRSRLPLSPSHSRLKPSASPGGCALEETEVTHRHVLSLPGSSQRPPTCPCAVFHLVSRAGLFENNPKCHTPLFPELSRDSPAQSQSQTLPSSPGPPPPPTALHLGAPLRPHQPPTCPSRFPAPAILFPE